MKNNRNVITFSDIIKDNQTFKDTVPSKVSGIYAVSFTTKKLSFADVEKDGYYSNDLKDGERLLASKVQAKYNDVKSFYAPYGEERVLYIGRAKDLRRRLKQFAKYGQGLVKNHRGGRYIFAIKGWEDLEIQIEVRDDYKEEEGNRIRAFRDKYGELPFANKKLEHSHKEK